MHPEFEGLPQAPGHILEAGELKGVRSALLGDIAELNPGCTERPPDDAIVSFVPMAAVSAITAATNSCEERIYRDVAKGYTPFLAGDLLVAKITPCFENGKLAQANIRHKLGFGSSEFHVVRPLTNQADGRYLLHFLRQDWIRCDGERQMTGSAGQRRVPEHFLAQLKVPLPPLPEQRRIAAILDEADALRAKRRAAMEQLDSLTQAVFVEMFGDPVTNPKSFPILRMGDVCDVRDGTHDSPKYVSAGGYPLVTSRNLTGGVVDLTDVNFISEADYQHINKRSKVDRGDIVMPMIGTIGSPVLVEDEPEFAIKNVALIKFCEASPSALFVRQLLGSDYFDHVIGRKNRGGTQKFVSLGDLRDLPLPLPPQAAQREFARRVRGMEEVNATCLASMTLLDVLFASVQSQAFGGAL